MFLIFGIINKQILQIARMIWIKLSLYKCNIIVSKTMLMETFCFYFNTMSARFYLK